MHYHHHCAPPQPHVAYVSTVMAVQESADEGWQQFEQPASLWGCWQGNVSQPNAYVLACAASVLGLRTVVHLPPRRRLHRTSARNTLPVVPGQMSGVRKKR